MGILDTAKEAIQLVQKIDNIELYKQILELQSEAIKMVEDTVGLRTQVKALEDRLKTKETLLFEDNSYWIQRAELKEGPFCSLCWDKADKLVRKHLDTTKRWYCPTHETANYPFSVD